MALGTCDCCGAGYQIPLAVTAAWSKWWWCEKCNAEVKGSA